MAAKYDIDKSIRKCEAPNCDKSFTMLDYPPGYFAYKYQVRKGSMANTCPSCELKVLLN